MDIAEDELKTWKQLIFTDKWRGGPALDALDKANHEHFVAVCHALLGESSPIIRRVALAKLGQRGDQNDALAQQGAFQALKDKHLCGTALFALARVGTPEAFPVLVSYAAAGLHHALRAASQQARTIEQQKQVIDLSRDRLFSDDSQLRAAAVEVLMQHSTVAAEQDTLLRSAEMFTDDFVFDVLRHASAAALPRLYALSMKYASGAEHKAIMQAIRHIENQRSQS